MAKRRTEVEELEPRVLLSGELAGALALPPDFTAQNEPQAIIEDYDASATRHVRHELVFIDSGIEDWETLVDDLIGRSTGERTIEVVELRGDRDGLLQISEKLERTQYELDAVHVVSHGTDGGIQLGGTWLDQRLLESRNDWVAGWKDALTEDADLLLYGCNLAGSAEGKALIDRIAGLTGADVAASTDLTGAAAFGGDWDLEHQTGSIESFVIFTARTQAGFGSVLDGTAIWVQKDEVAPQTREFNGVSFGSETDTAPVGEWEVMVGAEAPTRDEKIVMGIDKDGLLTAQIWDGTNWSVLSSVTGIVNEEEWSFDVAYSSLSGDALMMWANGAGGGFSYATWDGTFSTVGISIGVVPPGDAAHLKLAADPNSNAIAVAGSLESIGDLAMVWDGSNFVDGRMFPLGAGSPEVTDVDVVYEGTSGRAMFVYGDGSDSLRYALYDGGSWTEGIVAPPVLGGDEVRWTSVASDPNSDRIAVAVATDGGEVWLSVWNGTTWEPSVAGSDVAHDDNQGVAVAFESTSGQAIAVYAANEDEIRYQTWTPGVGWSGELIGPNIGTHAHALTLDADPFSATVMLSLVDGNRDVQFLAWDGDSWGAPNLVDDDATVSVSQPFLFLWEQTAVVNTAPVLTPSAPSMPPISEDEVSNPGELISNLLGGSISDPDSGALEGIAITNVVSGNGSWEYNLGAGWIAVGSMSDTSALLLRATDLIRFVPDAQNGETPSFDFRAWDRTSGSAGALANTSAPGGNSAFSIAIDTASLIVGDVNDAPTLIAATPVFDDVTANSGPPVGSVGTLVSALIDFAGGGGLDNVSDVDTGAVTGIAITGSDPTNGTWYYSIDAGANWFALGSPNPNNARLLSADPGSRLYFEPDAGFSGTVSGFRYCAWDQSSGSNGGFADTTPPGGTTAFSTAQQVADISVVVANGEPSGSNNSVVTDEDNSYVFQVGDFGFSDVDGDGFLAVTITTIPASGTLRNGASVLIGGESVSVAAIAAGDLVFSPGGDENGSPYTSFTFVVQDDSALSGSDTDLTPNTMTIEVSAINDAPVLTPSGPSLTPISEDDLANLGDLVSDLLAGSTTDADASDPEGIAITSISSTYGSWEYSTNGGTVWNAVSGSVSETMALLLRASDRLRFVPDGMNAEVASFDFRAWDQTSGSTGSQVDVSSNGGMMAFSAADDTGSITVSAVNDAPVLTPSAPDLTPIDEDDLGNSGDPVSSLLVGVSDGDGSSVDGIAITSLTSSNGTWEYSLDGGTIWNAVGAVSNTSALLLRDSDLVRFVPDGENSDAASFDFRAWDRTSGTAGGFGDTSTNGGTSAFSSSVDTASITVASVNDAPVLDSSGSMTLTNIVEDDLDPPGNSVASILLTAAGDRITDVDSGATEGIAVVGVDDTNGTWEYSVDGGSIWTAFGVVADTDAVLLDDDARIRFVPAASYTGPTGTVDFRAWDQTAGSNGQVGVDTSTNGADSAFSVAIESASASVIATNDAPVLNPSGPSLTGISEDATNNVGDTVMTIVGGSITDLDVGAFQGVAVTNLSSGNGTWEYSFDGIVWNAIPLDVSDSSALLLRDSDRIRFVPDGLNADAASFGFRAWDQTSGSTGTQVDVSANGGTTAFSLASDTASISVGDVNDAPVLDNTGDMSLSDVSESTLSPAGDTVASIISSAGGDRITDVDSGDPEGIAVVAVDDTNGSWQYSTDGGFIWSNFGGVTDASAVLLDAGDRMRFVPDVGYIGAAGNVEFRAWDQSVGSAGQTGVDTIPNGLTTPFSLDKETASLSVVAENFAPVLNPNAPTLTPIDEDETGNSGDLVSDLLSGLVSDLNLGAAEGIAITSLASSNGTWQYSIDAGLNWNNVGSVSQTNALLLRESDRVRFVPDAQNADTASFDFRAWDQSTGLVGTKADVSTNGGGSAFSVASDTASINVSPLNDAGSIVDAALDPVLASESNPPGETVGNLFGSSFSDVDAGSSLGGVAVVANTADALTQGVWQYSSDGGSNWFAVGTVADDASALVLTTGSQVRFVSVGGFEGSSSLSLRALDDSYTGTYSSTAGASETRANVDASINGGTNAVGGGVANLAITVLPSELIPIPDDLDPPEPPAAPPDAPATDPEAPTESSEPIPDPSEEPVLVVSSGAPPAESVTPLEFAPPPSFIRDGAADIPAEVVPELDRKDTIEESAATTGERTALDVLRDVFTGQSQIGADVLTEMIFNGRRLDFFGDLDSAQEDLLALNDLEVRLVGSTVAVTSGLSVGYVLWLTRGGLLIASLMSSMPAWKLIDPIPVLARLGPESEEDAESLGSMVDGEPEADAEEDVGNSSS